MLAPFRKSYDQPRQRIKKQRHYFANKGPSSQGYFFSSIHLWMWELDYKEDWVPKNWCFQTVVLEKTLESPLDCKEIKPVNSKGNQPWMFIGRNDAEAETAILWPPDAKSQLIRKDPDAGKDWRQRREGDDRGRDHHRFKRHEFEQAPGVGDGQGSLACCSPWGLKESDTTERLNNNKAQRVSILIDLFKNFCFWGFLRWEGARKTCLWLLDRQIKNVYFRALKFCK